MRPQLLAAGRPSHLHAHHRRHTAPHHREGHHDDDDDDADDRQWPRSVRALKPAPADRREHLAFDILAGCALRGGQHALVRRPRS